MNDLESLKQDEKAFALLSHLLALFTGFWAPLIIWLIKKDESAFIELHAKESLNFQISIAIYILVSSLLTLIIIGIFLIIAILICDLVFIILASVKANNGEEYRYPLCIRFIK